jgi:hypothetical protein
MVEVVDQRSHLAGRTAVIDGPSRWKADAAVTLPRICFVHIPKTAGSSVRAFFLDVYGDLAFHAHTTLDYQAASEAELSRYQFYGGHTYRSDWSRLPGDARFLTIMREPVDRLISLYQYWNTIDLGYLESVPEPDRFLVEAIRIAHTCPIEEFALSDSPAIVEHVRNAYARQLIRTPTNLNSMLDSSSTAATFDESVEVLFSFDVVLTTGRLDRSFAPALAHLGFGNSHEPLGRKNKSAMHLSCDKAEVGRILSEISPLDYRIYAVARQLEARFV